MEYNFAIHGKKVKLVYNFGYYNNRLYRNDFKDLLVYQKKEEEITQPRDLDLKFLYIKEFKNIPYKGLSKYIEQKYPYDFFQKTTLLFLNRIFYQILSEFPALITSQEEFEIQVKIVRVHERDYYANYDEDTSDAEHLYLEISALWLLNTILLPWVHFKRIDYTLVHNFLVHTLQHHVENVNKKFTYEKQLENKWKLKAQKISNFGLLFLLSSLLELRTNGFADFTKKRNFPRFDIHTNMIFEFRKNLAKLITIRKKEEAEKFFITKLSYQSYLIEYCGSLMCYFIALYLTKNTINKPVIVLGKEQYPLEDLNTLMIKNKNFFIQGLPNAAFDRAYRLISETRPIEFLNMYNHACDNLKIEYRNRVLWWQLFVKHKIATTQIYEKERLKRIIKKGYKP